VTAVMAALLFFNGLSAIDGFGSFADCVYAPEAKLSLKSLQSQSPALLDNLTADDLEHWFRNGLGAGQQREVPGRRWCDVMQPALAAHEARVCKEYMLALAALFRRKDPAEILKAVTSAVLAKSSNALSLETFVSALLDLLLAQTSEDDGSILRAAGEGGLRLMRNIWSTAFPVQEGQALPTEDLEQAVRSMSHATSLLLPDHQGRALMSLLLLASLNDIPLAQATSPIGLDQLCLYDYLCDSSDAEAPAPPSEAAPDAAAAAQAPQLSCETFSKSIVKLLENYSMQDADVRSLWQQLFGSSDKVDKETWSRVLTPAGIRVLDEQVIDYASVSQPPRDRLLALFDQIPSTADAALLCQAVQFECRSHPDALHILLQEACTFYGLVTRDGLIKALSRCVQKYSDGGSSSRGDPLPLQNVSSLADILWNVGSFASASPGAKDTHDTGSNGSNVLLPTIIIAAIIEAIRKYAGQPSVSKSAAAAPRVTEPAVQADADHPVAAAHSQVACDESSSRNQAQHPKQRTGKYVGDDDDQVSDGTAESFAKSAAAAPRVTEPAVQADADHPVAAAHSQVACDESSSRNQAQHPKQLEQRQYNHHQQHKHDQQQQHLHLQVQQQHQQQQQQQASEQLVSQVIALSSQLKVTMLFVA
jgi:hypothetical protein